jgi:hypothetical protein
MWLTSWLAKRRPLQSAGRRHGPSAQRSTFRPRLEALEDRTVPSTFYAATASDLVVDIQKANQQGGANTIVLTAPTTSPYVLTAVNNTTDGPTVLPVIASGDNLTILTSNGAANPGYGDVIDAGKLGRLFDVASGGSLTLENVTLQNGKVEAFAPAVSAEKGGAIYNQGTLVLDELKVQNNAAIGYPGKGVDAAGGGVWSNGALTVENATVFQGNSASGSNEGLAGLDGGNAFGGAIYTAGGSANITDSTFGPNNSAVGGAGGTYHKGGSAYGGAVYVAGGTVTLSGDVIGNPAGPSAARSDWVQGGSPYGWGYGGGVYVAGGTVTMTNDTVQYNVDNGYVNNSVTHAGHGGGIYIAPPATVYLDSYTVANTVHNSPDNIYGTYTLLS